jgi:hypothetical protein
MGSPNLLNLRFQLPIKTGTSNLRALLVKVVGDSFDVQVLNRHRSLPLP